MRLESGDVRLELRPDKPDVIEARARTGGEARTHVHVKQRWFDRELAGTLPEVFSLKERCALSTVPVSVNGEVVSQGRDLAGAIVQVPIDAPGFVGVAGFLPDAKERRTSALSLIRDGVRITSEVWEDVEPRSIPFVVRVEGGVLRKDASQSSIVRDEAYERLLEVVYRSYFEALAAALREEPTARWAREKLWNAIRAYPRQVWKDLPFLDRLAEAVTLEEARGSGGRTSLRTMLELLARDGAVLCATRPYPDLEPSPEGPPVCVVKDPALAAHLFDGRARYVDEDLAERQRLHEVQVRWRARALAHLPETPGATATVTWQGPGMRVECRILTPGPSTSLMHLVKDGCRVVDRDLCLALNGAEVLLEAPLTTTRDLDDVVRDERYAEALLALADGLPSLLAALARLAPSSPAHRIRDRVARAWSLLLTEDPGFLILRSAGFERDQAWQLVEQRRGRLAVAWSGPAIEPLVQVPLFRTWNVGLVSLAQVRQQAEEDGKVWFAAVAPANRQHLTRALLELDGRDRMILETYLPGGALRPYDAGEDGTWWERVEKAEGWTEDPDAVWRTPVSGDGLSGFVALPGPGTPEDRLPAVRDAIRVTLLKDDRVLGWRDFHSPAGPLTGRVRCDALSVDPTGAGPRNDLALRRVAEAVRRAALELVAELCRRYADLGPDARVVVVRHLHRASLDPGDLLGLLPGWPGPGGPDPGGGPAGGPLPSATSLPEVLP